MDCFAVAIFGPTGVGKTSLSLNIAKKNCEIISVDSMQVYKYLDIGTAKVTEDQLNSVPHHLINCVEPDFQWNASLFKKNAEILIPEIIKKKNYHC